MRESQAGYQPLPVANFRLAVSQASLSAVTTGPARLWTQNLAQKGLVLGSVYRFSIKLTLQQRVLCLDGRIYLLGLLPLLSMNKTRQHCARQTSIAQSPRFVRQIHEVPEIASCVSFQTRYVGDSERILALTARSACVIRASVGTRAYKYLLVFD